jgi:hypothetical protein
MMLFPVLYSQGAQLLPKGSLLVMLAQVACIAAILALKRASRA